MRKHTLFICAALASLSMQAQKNLRIWQHGEDKVVKVTEAGEMKVSGTSITIAGKTYQMSAIDSIIVVPQVTVAYNGATASVSIPASVAADVTATVSGADVVITNKNVSNECEFVVSGTSTNGSLTYNGSYKTTLILDGLNLTSTKGAPLDIQCGKRVALQLAAGTNNSLADAANGAQKACLYCKGHLEVEGSGSLTVTGNARHAIATKEYLQLKKSTGNITIAKAASDGIHAGQYFQMNGGIVTFDGNTMADGIQAEAILKSDGTIDPAEENNGQVIIKGGTIKGTITHEDCKAIKADTDIAVSGGTISINAQGNGSRGIQTDGSMTISEADNTTTIDIAAAGGLCTLKECVDDPHRCMGIKVDGNLTVTGGTTTVTNTGKKSRGIKVGGIYSKTGGTVNGTVSQ